MYNIEQEPFSEFLTEEEKERILKTPESEKEDLFNSLVEAAIKNKTTPFEYIKNIDELAVAKECKRSINKVITMFTKMQKAMYKTYCKKVKKGEFDFNLLVAHKKYEFCQNFYKKEIAILEDMMDEYQAYLNSGHYIDQYVKLETRRGVELYDHRNPNNNG